MPGNMIDIEKYYSVKNQIIEFIFQNCDNYSEKVFAYLKMMLITDDFLSNNRLISCSLLQILSKFDVLKREYDYYKVFAQMLYKYDLLKGNCCEVAAGSYPRVSEIVYPIIEENHSSLTIYDPKLTIERLGNAKLYKEKFNHKTNIDDIDTMFGLFPCAATIPLVEKALEEDKNLLVAFCGCDHSTDNYPLWDGNYWAEDLCMILKEDYGSELKILKWPAPISDRTPILLRKRRKNIR